MKAFKCDRCGRLYEDITLTKKVIIDVDKLHMEDLCPKCQEDFELWLKRKPRKPKRGKVNPIEVPEFNGGFEFR